MATALPVQGLLEDYYTGGAGLAFILVFY